MALEEDLGEAAAALEECDALEDAEDSLVWALPSGSVHAYGLEVDGTENMVIPIAPTRSGRSGIFVALPKTDEVNESPSVSVLTQSMAGALSKKKKVDLSTRRAGAGGMEPPNQMASRVGGLSDRRSSTIARRGAYHA